MQCVEKIAVGGIVRWFVIVVIVVGEGSSMTNIKDVEECKQGC